MASPPGTWRNRSWRSKARAWLTRHSRPPRRLRFTREGKVFVGITIGVGIAAINTGNNLLFLVLGLLLSLVILSGVLSEIALRGLDFKRRLPRRTFAGTACLVEIEVHNTKRYAPSYSIEVEDRVEGRRTDKRCYFLKVSGGARQTAAYRRIAPVRGVERYVSLRVATRFPFGLFEKWREVDMPEEQVVYPTPWRTARQAPPVMVSGDRITREERGHGEIDGVRELSDGDPVRDIHWAKTAAVGRLVARERRREGARAVKIVVDNAAPRTDDAVAQRMAALHIEDEIRKVAATALDALREGAEVQLVPTAQGDGPRVFHARPGALAGDRVLGYLACLPPEPPMPDDPPQVPSTPPSPYRKEPSRP